MLKVCIKHFIYDFCINVFFDRLKANFNTVLLSRVPRAGDFLSKISHKYDDEHYYNCTINSVKQYTNEKKETYYLIELGYQSCNGTVFKEDDPENDDDLYDDGDTDDDGLTDYERLLNDEDIDAIGRESYLSIRYERYNFFI